MDLATVERSSPGRFERLQDHRNNAARRRPAVSHIGRRESRNGKATQFRRACVGADLTLPRRVGDHLFNECAEMIVGMASVRQAMEDASQKMTMMPATDLRIGEEDGLEGGAGIVVAVPRFDKRFHVAGHQPLVPSHQHSVYVPEVLVEGGAPDPRFFCKS